MASFQYKAITEGGRLMQGTLEAGSHDEASQLLEQMPITVQELERLPSEGTKGRFARHDFLLFNQQLASITKAGIPLEQSLRELSRDIASRKMRTLIAEIATDLENGISIEAAFGKHEKQFPPLYSHLLKAGVETGQLGNMLTNLNRQVELNAQTKRIVLESVIYPAFLLVIIGVLTSFLYTYVIPICISMVREMVGGDLNVITEFVGANAHRVLPFWIGVGLTICVLMILWPFLPWIKGGRHLQERLIFMIPVLGRIHHSGALARLSETLAVTTHAGCPLPESLRVSAYATSSVLVGSECDYVAGQLETGQPILEAGALCHHVPRIFLYAMQLGIQRNNLPETLESLTRMYIEQSRSGQCHLQAVLLPTMIVTLGIIIAVSVLAVFLPMIQIIGALAG